MPNTENGHAVRKWVIGIAVVVCALGIMFYAFFHASERNAAPTAAPAPEPQENKAGPASQSGAGRATSQRKHHGKSAGTVGSARPPDHPSVSPK